MDNGEISLRAELGKMENPEEIKKLAEDAEMSGYEDVAKMANEKIAEILAKTNTVEKTSESQISQVENMGGSTGEIEKRTEGIDKQIEEVKTNATGEIEKVKNENSEGEKATSSITEKDAEIKNVETQTEEKIGEVKNETVEQGSAITQEKAIDPSLEEADNFQEFQKTLSSELFPKLGQQFQEFIKQKHGNLQEGSEEFKNKWREIATAVEYKGNTENPYIKQYKPDISLGEYRQNREELFKKMDAFNTIEGIKKKIMDDSAKQEKWKLQTIDLLQNDEKYKNEAIKEFKEKGFSSNKISNAGELQMAFEKGLVSANDIAQGLANKGTNSEITSQLEKLSSEVVDKIKNETVTTSDGRKIPLKQYIDSSFNSERTNFLSRLDPREDTNLQRQAFNLSEATSLLYLYKAADKPFDDEFKKVWNDKLKVVERGITEKDYVASSFYKNADLKMAIAIDKRILDKIVLPGLRQDLKKPNYISGATTTIEEMVKDNLLTREQADEMYKETLTLVPQEENINKKNAAETINEVSIENA